MRLDMMMNESNEMQIGLEADYSLNTIEERHFDCSYDTLLPRSG